MQLNDLFSDNQLGYLTGGGERALLTLYRTSKDQNVINLIHGYESIVALWC